MAAGFARTAAIRTKNVRLLARFFFTPRFDVGALYAKLGRNVGGIVISQVVPAPRLSAIPIVKA